MFNQKLDWNARRVNLNEGVDFVLPSMMSVLTLDAFALQTGSTSWSFTLTGDHETQEEKENSRISQCICTDDCSDCFFQLGNSLHVLWISLILYLIFVLMISVTLCPEIFLFITRLYKRCRSCTDAAMWVQHNVILGPHHKKFPHLKLPLSSESKMEGGVTVDSTRSEFWFARMSS